MTARWIAKLAVAGCLLGAALVQADDLAPLPDVGRPPEPLVTDTSSPKSPQAESNSGRDVPPVDSLPPLPVEGAPPEPLPAATEPLAPAEETEPADAESVVLPDLPIDPALSEPPEEDPESTPLAFLKMAGIGESQIDALLDGRPLSSDEQEVMLRILYRVRKFSAHRRFIWLEKQFAPADLLAEPRGHRAKLYKLKGRITRIDVGRPPEEVMARFEMKQFYRCHGVLAESGQPVEVITAAIPEAWPTEQPIDEPFSAEGLFLKVGPQVDGRHELIFLADRAAWHPAELDEAAGVNLGMTILASLGVDIGQFDFIENRRPISNRDREAFYQVLAAMGSAGTQQLVRMAEANLKRLVGDWKGQVKELTPEVAKLKQQLAKFQGNDSQREELAEKYKQARVELAMAHRSLHLATKGAFSVVPLFNRPNDQTGRLILLEGVARRAIKVRVAPPEPGGPNTDIVERFGITHYYELEVFTDDSQDNPIVFCVRDLPPGFPTGDRINEAIRVAGFYFKSWAYYTQKGTTQSKDGKMRRHQQLAPLLIGREPIWLQSAPPPRNPYLGVIAGGLFIFAVGGLWMWLWRFNRGDDEFRKKAIEKNFTIQQGESLNEMGIEAEDEPDFSFLD